jgi:hypothetical protein
MINFLFRFYKTNNEVLKEVRGTIESTTWIINNQFVEGIMNSIELTLADTQYWDILMECKNVFIVIENYNLSKQLSIRSFDNSKPEISLLKAKDCNLHIVGFEIKQASINKCEMFCANSNIYEVIYDLEDFQEFANGEMNEFIEKIELRNTNIQKLEIYKNVKSLVVSDSNVKQIESFSSQKKVLNINHLFLINTVLNSTMLNFNIDELNIEDSEIHILKFGTKSKIKKLTVVKSSIGSVYGCDIDTIELKDIETWKIIKNSAKCDQKEKLYYDACYTIAEIDGKNSNKVVDWFLRESIGYGYKPARALRFVIISIIGFGLLYSLIDLVLYFIAGNSVTDLKDFIYSCMNGFLKRIYFSGITFTTIGYGDITPSNILSKIIAVIEGCLGVSIFSLLIVSLTKRYIDN